MFVPVLHSQDEEGNKHGHPPLAWYKVS